MNNITEISGVHTIIWYLWTLLQAHHPKSFPSITVYLTPLPVRELFKAGSCFHPGSVCSPLSFPPFYFGSWLIKAPSTAACFQPPTETSSFPQLIGFLFESCVALVGSLGCWEVLTACSLGSGISSYRKNPQDAPKAFEDCMQKVKEQIPAHLQGSTHIYLGATAGMRLLRWEQEGQGAAHVT